MSLKFNNKRIGFNGKRLIASKTDEVIIEPVEEEYCPNCGEAGDAWDGEHCGNCGYPDNEDPGDDPFDPGIGDDPGGLEIG